MRHTLVVAIVAAALLIAWRVRSVLLDGRRLHEVELAGRATAESIQDAEESLRRAKAGTSGANTPYEFLAQLVAEGRVHGLERVADSERDVWRGGGYLFHVVLPNQLGRPIGKAPSDPTSEPGLGGTFQLWAWPADRDEPVLALYFANSSGYLLQGDNGSFAGLDARPEEAGASPVQQLDTKVANSQWIALRRVEQR
jgi:hypothetical protein